MHSVIALVDEPEARYAKEGEKEGDIEACVALAVGNGEGDDWVEEDTQERRHGRQAGRTRREPCKLSITCSLQGIYPTLSLSKLYILRLRWRRRRTRLNIQWCWQIYRRRRRQFRHCYCRQFSNQFSLFDVRYISQRWRLQLADVCQHGN